MGVVHLHTRYIAHGVCGADSGVIQYASTRNNAVALMFSCAVARKQFVAVSVGGMPECSLVVSTPDPEFQMRRLFQSEFLWDCG